MRSGVPGALDERPMAEAAESRILAVQNRKKKTIEEHPGFGVGQSGAEALAETLHAAAVTAKIAAGLREQRIETCVDEGCRIVGAANKNLKFLLCGERNIGLAFIAFLRRLAAARGFHIAAPGRGPHFAFLHKAGRIGPGRGFAEGGSGGVRGDNQRVTTIVERLLRGIIEGYAGAAKVLGMAAGEGSRNASELAQARDRRGRSRSRYGQQCGSQKNGLHRMSHVVASSAAF